MATFDSRVAGVALARGWSEPVKAAVGLSEKAIRADPIKAARKLAEKHGLQPFDEKLIMGLIQGVDLADGTVWSQGEATGGIVPSAPARLTPALVETLPPAPPKATPPTAGVTLGSMLEDPHLQSTLIALVASVAAAHARGIVLRNLALEQVFVGSLGDVTLAPSHVPMTPAYASPEQAADANSQLTPASDVFALGSILFEAHGGVSLFAGVGKGDTLAAVVEDRRREPKKPLPPLLARVVERATQVDRHRRFPDAGALLRALQAITTTEEPASLEARETALASREAAETALATLEPTVDFALRQAAWGAVDETRAAECQANSAVWGHALAGDLAALQAWVAPLEDGSERASAVRALLERHAELDALGQHRSWRSGKGHLSLTTDPPVSVDLYRFVERGGRQWPEPVGNVGTTPLERKRLPMGSYVALLGLDGGEVRYPFTVGRGQCWDAGGSVALGQVRDEREVFVPGGPFVFGSGQVRSEPGFFIDKHPVTTSAYLEFLTSMRVAGQDQALERCLPRLDGNGVFPRVLWSDGRYLLGPVATGVPWSLDWPMVGVPVRGAVAYARWRSAADDLEWCLPTETQWEKAARGVDGRAVPWGSAADPAYAVFGRAHPEVSRDESPDSSPYGVKGLGGNVSDWVLAEGAAPAGFGMYRGGNFAGLAEGVSSAGRAVAVETGSAVVGFRLVRAL